MADETRNSDLILRQARQSLAGQRAGGRRAGSIGQRSAALKRAHRARKLVRIVVAIAALWFGVSVLGMIVNGIGITGIILTLLATIVAVGLFGSFPRMKVPTRESLARGNTKTLVANTELWLERQRPALPAPAVRLVDTIGIQLDALGLQLDGLDERQPAAAEVRKLVGEHLPELVSSYTAIPRHLRSEPRAGRTPDEQLADSLGKISTEIDSVTRQLAAGAIDNLAIQTRYLDYKYGSALDEADPRQAG
jgi:TM2 domain-containing membrane protein YozV